ncbi:MAG: hypothetical protein WCD89_04950 [Anaerocolumna sp.]
MKRNNMRKLISLSLLLMIIVTVITILPEKVKADDITEVEVNEVKDIYDNNQLKQAKQAVSEGVNIIFSFTIEKPAYVYIKTDTTSFLGIAQTTFDLEGEKPVVNYGIVNNGDDKYVIDENTTYLEPGTYYIHYVKEAETQSRVDDEYKAPFTHKVSVSAQYINRTVNAGTTLSNAPKISTNKMTYMGFLSSSVRSQCYKFTIINKCVVFIEASAKVNSGLEYNDGFLKPYDPSAHSANIYLYNSKGKKLEYMAVYDLNKVTNTPIKTVLDPGTYYVELEDAVKPAMYGDTSLKVNASPTKYLAIPKVKVKKPGTKTIEGIAVPDSGITLYYNGKAYNTTTDLKGKYKISVSSKLVKDKIIAVYATKDKKQSKTLKVKVD